MRTVAAFWLALALQTMAPAAWAVDQSDGTRILETDQTVITSVSVAAPPATLAALRRSNAAYGKSDYVAALAAYSEAIRLSPKFALAYANRGWAYHGMHDEGRAATDLDKAISLDPTAADAFGGLAMVHHAMGQDARAITDFDEAIKRAPTAAA